MVSLKNIQWEVRLAFVLGVSALVLSPVVGIVAGNPVIIVLIRAVVFSIVFALIGYGSIFVIKKFVPEFYEAVFANANHGGDVTESEISGDEISDFSSESVDESGEVENGIEEELEPASETPDSSLALSSGEDSSPSKSGRKMGKHILEEKGMKFEPKLMAEAIRTMMSKDDE